MSDTTEDPTPVEGEPQDAVKVLRERGDKAVEEAKAAQAELTALQRELAFTKAGVPETGPGALLRKAYDGELTAEAVSASMDEYGISIPAPEAEAPTPTPQQVLTPAAVAEGLAPVHPAASANEADAVIAQMQAAGSEAELDAILRAQGIMGEESAGAMNLMPIVGLNSD